MTKIIPATKEHVESIATLLVKENTKINNEVGYSIYKTDYDLLVRVYNERVTTTGHGFENFVLVDEAWVVLWFVALLLKEERGEVLMIALKEDILEEEKEENTLMLLNFWIKYLKDNWVKFIIFETSGVDEKYKKNLTEQIKQNAKPFLNKWIMFN